MPNSVISNGKIFQFKDLVLHGVLTSWNHRIGIRLASHEYLKRDGGEQEPMGAAVGYFAYRCVIISPNATAQYNAIVLSIRQNPRGSLVDPRLGKINAACEGIEATENAEQGIDSIEFDIRFREDAVDTSIVNDQPQGPQQFASAVTQSTFGLNLAIQARFGGNLAISVQAMLAILPNLISAANSYTTAAIASIQTTSPDATLNQLLGAVKAQQDAFLASLTATLAFTLEPDVSLTPYRLQAREVYAQCVQLNDAISALKPPIILFPITTATPLPQIASALYGKDARAKIPEILSLNRIATPYWIPQGIVLKVTQPQIRQ